MTLYTGKRPATYDSRDLLFADIRPKNLTTAALPNIPGARGGFGTDFKDWGMLGNGPADDNSIPSDDMAAQGGAGCCAWSGPGHETMESDKNAGRPVARFTCLNILEQYSAYEGYNLQTGANDNGSNVRDVLRWRQTKGLLDADGKAHKIGTYVALEPGNLQQMWEALYLFEAVGIGVEFPGSAMDQTNAGKTWSVVPGATIEGGHYVPLFGHPTASIWTCVTWGRRQTMTPQWLSKYCDEAWAWVDAERYNQVTGETVEKFVDADLEKFITLLTTQG